MSPRAPQITSQMVQNDPKSTPPIGKIEFGPRHTCKRPQTTPKAPQIIPRAPKVNPRAPKVTPRAKSYPQGPTKRAPKAYARPGEIHGAVKYTAPARLCRQRRVKPPCVLYRTCAALVQVQVLKPAPRIPQIACDIHQPDLLFLFVAALFAFLFPSLF